ALIRSLAPDIAHAHMPPAELYTRLALLVTRPRPAMLITKHNDEPFYRGIGHRQVGRWSSAHAEHIIAISDAVRSYTCQYLCIPASRVTTVHYGIDPTPYEVEDEQERVQIRAAWRIPPNALVIGTVARFVPQKALHVLLKAYARYRSLSQQSSHLVLVGQGPLEDELQSLAQHLGLENKVVLAGFREDISSVMKAFDIFALTSTYEGFGLVLLEAMAAKRPVVASRVSAIPEIVQHEITGLLCPSGDHQAFAEALLRLEEPSLRVRLGTAGYERVTTRFTIARMIDSTLRIYETCLKSHNDSTG
ncbi:MAG: glycosyltransferase family 4 protein, partial [Nitrospira sp.]|nr:glycosyltransferase family 4 protein [Nitrospira sp.]